MPLEFPEDALEAIAADCDLTARDWHGDGSKPPRRAIAQTWLRKAATIRQAIDAYRAATSQAPITRRARLSALIEQASAGMDKAVRHG